MLLPESKCTGCGSCVVSCPKQCIHMYENDEGFLYPKVDENVCVRCGACEKSCPVLNCVPTNTKIEAFAAKNRNNNTRLDSSSGGVFPVLAEYVLSRGGYVCGAVYDESFGVKHILTNLKADIKRMQGAKYAQSVVYPCYEQIKRLVSERKYVLFVGTPCQVQAIQRYINKKNEFLITADMVCHGVPSPKVWRGYLKERSEADAVGHDVMNINMRSKCTGWSKYQYSMEIAYSGGRIYRSKQESDLFMNGFTQNLFLRRSCAECAFRGISRSSDFTLGDYWGIWNQYPSFDDNRGTSLVLLHTDHAIRIWEYIQEKCEIQCVDVKQAISENKSVVQQSYNHGKRDEFFLMIHEGETVINAITCCLFSQNREKTSVLRRFWDKIFGN